MPRMAGSTPRRFVTFEGYDGSGKSSLIDAVRNLLAPTEVRVVGRKKEPELLGISGVLESEDRRLDPAVEMLLRIALEMERQRVIDRALLEFDLVLCDRGSASVRSWLDYLHVAGERYESLLRDLVDYHHDSLTIVCSADFDTCWRRISNRPDKSWKERQGVDENRRYFAAYHDNIRRLADSGADLVFVDTVENGLAQSVSHVWQALESRGYVAASTSARAEVVKDLAGDASRP